MTAPTAANIAARMATNALAGLDDTIAGGDALTEHRWAAQASGQVAASADEPVDLAVAAHLLSVLLALTVNNLAAVAGVSRWDVAAQLLDLLAPMREGQ